MIGTGNYRISNDIANELLFEGDHQTGDKKLKFFCHLVNISPTQKFTCYKVQTLLYSKEVYVVPQLKNSFSFNAKLSGRLPLVWPS